MRESEDSMLARINNSVLRIMAARAMREEEGQGMAEYGLILVGIAIAAFAAFQFMGGKVSDLISSVGTDLTT